MLESIIHYSQESKRERVSPLSPRLIAAFIRERAWPLISFRVGEFSVQCGMELERSLIIPG